MRRCPVRRYSKLLAGILAASLMISSMPADVQARSAYQEHTSTQTVSQEYIDEKENNEEGISASTEDRSSDETSDNSENTEEITTEEKPDVNPSDSTEASTEDMPADGAEASTEDMPADSIEVSPEDETTEEVTEDTAGTKDAESEEDMAELAAAGALSLDDLTQNSETSGVGKTSDGAILVSNATSLILLSNCKASDLAGQKIIIDSTGKIDASGSGKNGAAEWNGSTYHFSSIGTDEYPFEGSLTVNGELFIDTALFGTVTSGAEIKLNKITWTGKSGGVMIAGHYELKDTESHTFSGVLSATSNEGKIQDDAVMGCLFGRIDGLAGTLDIAGTMAGYTSPSAKIESAGNVGFVCGTLGAGCTVVLDGYVPPLSGEVKSTNGGNAGGLVGELGAGAKLSVNMAKNSDSQAPVINGMTVTSLGNGAVGEHTGNAGGLVGYAGDGAVIDITSDVDLTLSGSVVTGKRSAGGVAGAAYNVDLLSGRSAGKVIVSGGTMKAMDANTGLVGGAFGEYILDGSGNAEFPERLEVAVSDAAKVTVAGNATKGNPGQAYGIGSVDTDVQLGGLIGSLELDNSSLSISGKKVHVESGGGRERSYGGLVGHVVSSSLSSSLVISDCSVTSSYVKHAYYHGGVVGEIGQTGNAAGAAYLEVDNVTAVVGNPWAGRDGNVEDMAHGYGGIAARVSEGCVLKLDGRNVVSTRGENLKDTSADKYIWQGGGVAGYVADGAAVELNGTTDLSGTYIKQRGANATVIGAQGNALIYAHGDGNGTDGGWKLIRPSEQNAVDDIGNYGQVLRLRMSDTEKTGLPTDFITLDSSTHNVKLKQLSAGSSFSGAEITVKSMEEFALLAVTWQSQGVFSADAGITTSNWNSIKTKNIILGGDVDLAGTGITGLTRDETPLSSSGTVAINEITDSYEYFYSGEFDGGGHIIKLAVGEAYGYRGGTPVKTGELASGVIHGHAYNGLFAGATGQIKNVTIGGQINVVGVWWDQFNNNGTVRDIYAGGYAAILSTTTSVTIENVTITVSENIGSVDDVASSFRVNIYSGGLCGYVNNNGTITLGADGRPVTSGTKIDIISPKKGSTENRSKGNYMNSGGLIGRVKSKNVTINCDNVVLNGSIEIEKVTNPQIGALICWIEYNGTSTSNPENTKVNINRVTVDGQRITAKSGTSIGGMFGHKWAETMVTFKEYTSGTEFALNIKNMTFATTATKSTVGGLVYRANGKWTLPAGAINIEKADISFKAGSGELGMLVYKGGDETKNKNQRGALYIEMTDNWTRSYRIDPDNVIISSPGLTIYDEFAARLAVNLTNGALGDSACADATNGMNGIISLATENRAGVGVVSGCNTYQNQTAYGKDKTNRYSRYYYNLDTIMNSAGVNSGEYADSAEKLLIWSVYTYASSSLKRYFNKWSVDKVKTIGAASGVADLDMKGLSYYALNADSSNITVKNARITFYNSEIENREQTASNKQTRLETSQHYLMHCGLFYNVAVDMNVTGVTFAGSVGKPQKGSAIFSGALCCGEIKGSGSTNILEIVLSDITLDGLKVTGGEKTYAPLLIGSIGGYADFKITTVKTSGYDNLKSAAGSSLMGNVGNSSTATMITGTFKDIRLPDKKVGNTGIFSRATLMNMFSYKDGGVGSIVYNFNKDEDWKDGNHANSAAGNYIHHVTYGKEISDSVQYKDLQHFYYDKELYNSDAGLVRYENSGSMENKPSFSSYLPYVYNTYDASSKMYEIVVNQRVSDMISGCGTYGHPYVITDPLEMSSIAEYINSQNAKAGWKIRITDDQTVNHTDKSSAGKDTVYVYEGDQWAEAECTDAENDRWTVVEGGKTLSNKVMHRYILSAYYDIQAPENTKNPDESRVLSLNDFVGLGTDIYAFRGVIVSTNGSTIKISGDVGNGFIKYSYGSVLKDINIEYDAVKQTDAAYTGRNLTYNKGDILTQKKYNEVTYSPKVFWGGVIGCVLGGDNIIDNVKVTFDSNWKLALGGSANNLIQAGGYVGSVAGGGVIFRNMSGTGGLTDSNIAKGTDAGSDVSVNTVNSDSATQLSFYINPYVGRVLDGYAFSENCTLDNGNKNYKINQITMPTGKKDIVTAVLADKSQFTTTINNAQGLLIFSAIVNSGAAAGGDSANNGTKAYSGLSETYTGQSSDANYNFGNGIYGKVRNASYAYVGAKADDIAESLVSADFARSVSDDTSTPGCSLVSSCDLDAETNAPYLVRNYSNDSTFYVSGWNGKSYNKLSVVLADNTTYDMKSYGLGYQGISARYVSSAFDTDYKNGNLVWGASYVKPLINGFDGNGSTVKVNMNVKEYALDDFHAVSVGGVFNLIRAAKTSELNKDMNGRLVQDLNITESSVSLQYYSADGTGNQDIDGFDAANSSEKGQSCVGVGGFAGNSSQNGINNVSESGYTIEKVHLSQVTVDGPVSAGGIMGNTSMGNKEVIYDAGLMLGNRKQEDNYFCADIRNCTYDSIQVSAHYFAGGFIGYAGNNNKIFNWDILNGGGNDTLITSLTVSEETYSVVGKNSTVKNSCAWDKNGSVCAAGGALGAACTKFYVNKESGEDAPYAKFTNVTVISENTKISNKSQISGYHRLSDAGTVVGRVANAECVIRNIEVTAADAVVQATSSAGGILGCTNSNNKKIKLENCKVTGAAIEKTYLTSGGLIGGVYWLSGDTVIEINNCQVLSSKISGSGDPVSAGGFVGCNRGSQPLRISGCVLDDVQVNSKYNMHGWNGLAVGSMGDEAAVIYVYDTLIKASSAYGTSVGGLTGSLHNTVLASNVRIDGITVNGKNNGILFGVVNTSQKKTWLAGISIKNCSGKLYDESFGKLELGTKAYISFADYNDAAKSVMPETDMNLLNASQVNPYVNTSPKSPLALYGGESATTPEYLYGDSVSWEKSDTGAFQMTAEQIFKEAVGQSAVGDGLYQYSSIGMSYNDFDFTSSFSTYNANQTEKAAQDFPVLQITGGNTDTIEKYLNIVTNGGYGQAKTCSAVTVDESVYEYKDGKFVKNAGARSPLIIKDKDKSTMSFSASSDYDNDKNRFTLLTVTFKIDDDHAYNVFVPVLVRRVLEVDFTATLSYGTHYNSEDYKGLKGHVLDSYGNPMTGYLTYTYGSAEGTPVEYGWQNYVDAGGDVSQTMEKKIHFVQTDRIPAGTQLTLVDCQDANKTAYYYTVTGSETEKNKFNLGDFESSDGKKFSSGSIGERLGVTVQEDNAGLFVEVQKDGKPVGADASDEHDYPKATVLKDGRYYRLKTSDDNADKLYSVTMNEVTYTENYYLVVTMMSEDKTVVANGYVITEFDGDIPYNIHYMLRKETSETPEEDGHSNSASTYQISSGYSQVLTENTDDLGGRVKQLVTAAENKLKVSVKDEVTFPNGQAYINDKDQIYDPDQLYQRFVANLQIVQDKSISYASFPSGTSGEVKFYAYEEKEVTEGGATKTVRTYYRYAYSESERKKVWSPIAGNEKDFAAKYNWTSDGGNMELILSEDGSLENAISLQGLRDYIRGGKRTGDSRFYIEAVMDAELPALGLDVIPKSTLADGTPENYAKLNYVSQLSTEKKSLSYSSTRASYSNTQIAYYQKGSQGSAITYNADNIDQLGINLLDLDENLDADKTHALIATTAVYDLHEVRNLESLLKRSKYVKFSLSLSRKNDSAGATESYTPLGVDSASYMNVRVTSPNAGNISCGNDGKWTWKVPKSYYIDENTGNIKTSDIFDGSSIIQAVTLLVNIDNVEDSGHFFANYNVTLTAELFGETTDDNGQILAVSLDRPDPENDNVIYTLTKIKPEFVDEKASSGKSGN